MTTARKIAVTTGNGRIGAEMEDVARSFIFTSPGRRRGPKVSRGGEGAPNPRVTDSSGVSTERHRRRGPPITTTDHPAERLTRAPSYPDSSGMARRVKAAPTEPGRLGWYRRSGSGGSP